MAGKITEIRKNEEGFGYLIERDAGYISADDPRNKLALSEISSFGNQVGGDVVEIKDRLKVFAVFQKHGIPNANQRIYPESVLKKQVEAFQKRIDGRNSYGELNHPESVTIDGERLAFLITKLWWEKNTLVGEMELILSPGFVKYGVISCLGDMVANYLRLGIRIGVSSRGLGSVEKDRFTGKHVVQDDFEITCWDIVTDGSTPGSWISHDVNNLSQYVESKNTSKEKIMEGLDKFLSGSKKQVL